MDDSGVATIVGALLVLAALVSFLVVYNVQWAPVFVENREGEASAALEAAVREWGETAERFVGGGSANRSFSQTVPLGVTTRLFTGGQRSTGTATLDTMPSLRVYRDSLEVANLTGGLRFNASFAQYPDQTLRYAFGALEVEQEGSAWVDLRGLVAAQRGPGGLLRLDVLAVGVSGAPQSQGGGSDVEVVGQIETASSATLPAATARLRVDNVRADAWRAAFTRVLSAASLTGETTTNCPASAQNWCFESGTNTATTVDLYLRNVGADWTAVWGTVRVELRV